MGQGIVASAERLKGWFVIPGVQDGDRTVESQLKGLEPALAECAGKTILDLGAAEGCIGREFARAGAVSVHGIDSVPGHIEVARQICAGLPMTFDVLKISREESFPVLEPYDIVLALGLPHKLRWPGEGVAIAARASRDLVLLRRGPRQLGGIVRSKHHRDNWCDSHLIMREHGFALEKTVPGSEEHGESVEMWRKR